MSPEQARGRPVDKRADLWAFGAVLYEMLTGRTAFPGETVSDTIVAILEREPDWAALPADVPSSVRTLIRRCLAKDRRHAHRRHLGRTVRPRRPRECAADDQRRSRHDHRCGAAWRYLPARGSSASRCPAPPSGSPRAPPVPFPRVSRFLITPPSATALTVSGLFRDLALTPDGTRLVYVGANGASLFVRTLDQLDATPLTGFNAAFGPFVSPDGQWIGVFDGASAPALKKVAITGGPAVTLGRPDGANPRRELGRGRHDHLRDHQCDDGPAADRGRGRRADRADAAEPGGRRSRPCLAGDSAGRPGGAVHDHGHDRPPRPGAGRGPRSPDRHADRADSGRQRRALRVERPSPVRRGGDAARCRLRPRPARRRRCVGGGAARSADDRDWRCKRRGGSGWDAGLRPGRRGNGGTGAAWCGWTVRARRRRCPHRRGPTSIRGSRPTAAASRSPSATRSWTSGCGTCRAQR